MPRMYAWQALGLLCLGLLAHTPSHALTFSSGGLAPGVTHGTVESTVPTTTAGILTATSFNNITLTAPASTATLTLGSGKTVNIANTLTFTGTDASSVAFGAGGTAAYTANKLSAFAATTSAELAGVLSDETGTGAAVFAGSPTFTGTVTGVDLSLTGNATIANNLAYQQKDSGGTARSLLSVSTGNLLFVGSTGLSDMALFAGGAVRAFPGGNEHLHLATNALLRYGANGPTTPALYVDASAASAVTGILITATAAGNAAHIDTLSTGSNEALVIAAKGTGSLVLSSNAANSVVVDSGSNITVLGLATTGAATGKTLVCADTAGKLYRSTSGVACAN